SWFRTTSCQGDRVAPSSVTRGEVAPGPSDPEWAPGDRSGAGRRAGPDLEHVLSRFQMRVALRRSAAREARWPSVGVPVPQERAPKAAGFGGSEHEAGRVVLSVDHRAGDLRPWRHLDDGRLRHRGTAARCRGTVAGVTTVTRVPPVASAFPRGEA